MVTYSLPFTVMLIILMMRQQDGTVEPISFHQKDNLWRSVVSNANKSCYLQLTSQKRIYEETQFLLLQNKLIWFLTSISLKKVRRLFSTRSALLIWNISFFFNCLKTASQCRRWRSCRQYSTKSSVLHKTGKTSSEFGRLNISYMILHVTHLETFFFSAVLGMMINYNLQ